MDTIFYNGIVHTMAGRTVSAVAVRGGRIALAGSDQEALSLRTPNTRCIDLRGRCVLPGFTDSHMHLLNTAMNFHRLNLSEARSIEELIQRGRDYIARCRPAPGEWIVGCGFDQNRFPEPVLPDGAVAEAISREHPVILDRICGHVGAGNKMALALAGFDENTVIPGGVLDKGVQEEIDRHGLKLFGVLPQDDGVYRCDCNGEPSAKLPDSSPMKTAVNRLMEQLGL